VGAAEIVPFESRYREDFGRLNLEWLRRYFRVEPIDEQVLSSPEAILRDGGAILFARLDGRIVGTCALIRHGGDWELSKMAVTADCQGSGIGRRLLEAAIAEFRARDGGTLYLETNSILAPAIRLYESAGFVHAPRPGGPSPYERADVYMTYRGADTP
jgi:ribosomal protein S18 acetylase RimI-like enzyme